MNANDFEQLIDVVAEIAKEWGDSPQLKGRLRLVLATAINKEYTNCLKDLKEQPTDYAI